MKRSVLFLVQESKGCTDLIKQEFPMQSRCQIPAQISAQASDSYRCPLRPSWVIEETPSLFHNYHLFGQCLLELSVSHIASRASALRIVRPRLSETQ